jgi:hypothetical protein
MESKPRGETGPPALIESVVRLLLPPPAREHVLGDLAERYTTPTRYAVEAARTVPFVLGSQIRRTSFFPLWPLVALMLAGGFGTGPGVSWTKAALPTIATMIGFMLRDAYRIRDPRRPWRQGLVDVSIAAAFAAASQVLVAIVRPDLLIAPSGVAGGAATLALLYLLRVQNPGRPARCVTAPDVATMTNEQLRDEIAGYSKTMRRSVWIEIAASGILIPTFTAFALMAPDPIVRLGAGMTVVGGLFVLRRMWRALASTTPIAGDADFESVAAIYRTRLQQQQHGLRTMWLWYLLPLTIGPALIFINAAQSASRPATASIGTAIALLAIWVPVGWTARQHARRMQVRIDALERAGEDR